MSKLSERVRPDVEAAPWVVEEIKKLEAKRDALATRVQEMLDRLDYTLAYIEERDDWEGREAIIADITNEVLKGVGK